MQSSLDAYREDAPFNRHDNSSMRSNENEDSINAKSHSSSPNRNKSVFMKTDPNNLQKKAGESTVIKRMGLMKI